MDIREFAQEFQDNVNIAVENENIDYDQELASAILEYLEDNGEVNAPEICMFQKTRARITAYDYNDEAESLDLFLLIKADTLLGKINKDRIEKGFNYLTTFHREVMSGNLLKSANIDNTEEIAEVANLILSTKGHISQLRLYIITNGLADSTAVPSSVETDEGDYIIEYNLWDMQRIYQQHNIRVGKEKIEIDFPTEYNIRPQCLKMNDDNPYVDAYLAIMPGKTLAKIYKKYQHMLLEKNVRTFLQFKGKVNRGIRKTLREKPDMFFSFNNGLSTTATEISVSRRDGVLCIDRIYDWQIVNGGQTTASIAASLNDHDVNLDKVFVPMKISVIRDSEDSDAIVKEISFTANSQTSIKNSDFSANDPYLIDLENFSRSEWVPNGRNIPICKWYFERTRGQYLDQLSLLSGFNEKSFKKQYPKKQKITKIDIAKYETSWNLRPYNVCKGAEKNYSLFVADIKREKTVVTSKYYTRLIAKAILYNTIDAIVREERLGGYKAIMNAYVMASISFLSNSNLDLTYIWENQKIQEDVVKRIKEVIPIVWEHIADNPSVRNVTEWSKKQDCWNTLKSTLNNLDRFSENLIQEETNDDGTSLNDEQKNCIKEAANIEANYWFELANWAKTNNVMSPLDRKSAFNLGTMRSRNRQISTLKQAQLALKLIERAKELGFKK